MPQHKKMHSITPQSKMASWISILCFPSLYCDTKQTHNKPSLSAQESILRAKTVCCPKLFLLLVQIRDPVITIWGHRGDEERFIFLKEGSILVFSTFLAGLWLYFRNPCGWVSVVPSALPRRTLRRTMVWVHMGKSSQSWECALSSFFLGCAWHPCRPSSRAFLSQLT